MHLACVAWVIAIRDDDRRLCAHPSLRVLRLQAREAPCCCETICVQPERGHCVSFWGLRFRTSRLSRRLDLT